MANTTTTTNTNKDTEYIYILQTREFIKSGESVYKIGRTTKPQFERFSQYPKGSELLMQKKCTDSKCAEKDIIKLFKTKYKTTTYGTEYFEGDCDDMIDDMDIILSKYRKPKVSDKKEMPYKCENCIKEFKYKSTYLQHLNGKICTERRKTNTIKQPKEYKCNVCNTMFKNKGNLDRHNKNNSCDKQKFNGNKHKQ